MIENMSATHCLTYFTWKSVRGSLANSADPDQTSHNVASDQSLYCLLTGFSIKNRIKRQNRPNTFKMTNEIIQHITAEESTRIQWVKIRVINRTLITVADEEMICGN